MTVARTRVLSFLTAAVLAVVGTLVAAAPASAVTEVVVTPASTGQYSEAGTWATARAAGYAGTPKLINRGGSGTYTVQMS